MKRPLAWTTHIVASMDQYKTPMRDSCSRETGTLGARRWGARWSVSVSESISQLRVGGVRGVAGAIFGEMGIIVRDGAAQEL